MQRQRGGTFIQTHQHRVTERRGRGIGKVAAARKLLTLVHYGLRGRRDPLLGQGRVNKPGRSRQRVLVVLSWHPRGEAESLIEPARLRPKRSMPPRVAKE